MRNLLERALLSVVIAMPVMAGAPRLASAQDFELHLGDDGPAIRLRDDNYDRDHRRRDEWREANRPGCSPDRAVNKAERMGLRRVRVVDVDRRTIEVRGQRRGHRVHVVFARAPHCPVIR